MIIEFTKYFFFGSSLLICIIVFANSEKLFKKSFFNKSALVALISTAIGIILELTNIFNLNFGITLLIMSVLLIYLIYFLLLLLIYRKLKGFNPYITSASSWIGNPIIYESKGKYKTDRKIIWEDFAFSILQAALPANTILFLLAYLSGKL